MSFQTTNTNMSLLTGYGILDREFRKQLGFTSPNFSDLSILRALKMQAKILPTEKTKRHEFYYYEQGDHLKTSITIAGVANTTVDGTPAVVVTLSAGDHYNSGANSYPIPGNDALFSNQVSGYVYSVDRTTPNAHTVTIKSITGSTDVQSAAVVNSVMNFVGVSVSEASKKVEHRNPVINKVTNKIKTTRAKYEVTDHAEQNQIEVTVIDGQPYLHYLGIANTTERFEMDEEVALLTNNLNTATYTDALGKNVTTTLGLIPNITANGQEVDWTGDIDLATIQDWFSTIIANYGDGEYMCLNGIDFGFALQNFSVDMGKYDASYLFFEGGKEQATNFNFTGIKMPGIGIQVYFKDAKLFSHAGSLGSEKLPYRGMGLFMPCGSALNPKTNEMQPYLRTRYSAPTGAAHEIQGDIKVWETGANAKNGGTSDELNREIHMVSYKALEAFNVGKFLVATKN
jgi:hypothetical protein